MNLKDAKGNWALVTGASSGIGRAFAVQLAAAGMNIIIIARRTNLLNVLSSELTKKFNVRVLVLPIDLSQANAIADIRSRLMAEGIKVRVLVNNAAVGKWGRFETTPLEAYESMIKLNALIIVSLCHCFLEDLTSFPTSAIINVSSQAAYNPVPYMAVYAATKAFVSSFSQALYGEWRERGILVQTLMPGPTESEFDTTAGAYNSAIRKRVTADVAVSASLANLASDRPLVVSAQGTFRQRIFATLFPAKMVIKTVARMFRPPKQR